METSSVVRDFIESLAAQDFTALGECLDSGVQFRALIPPGSREASEAEEAVAFMRRWFGAADRIELKSADIHPVGDRFSVRYAMRVHEDQWYDVEQQAYCTVADGRISSMELLCSGFLPVDGER